MKPLLIHQSKTGKISGIPSGNQFQGLSADHLLEFAPDPRVRTHLLASTVKELDVWLDVLPISSLSLRMDDSTIRVAVGLRLGSPLCMPHKYHHCGAEVDSLSTHGLSCSWSEGCHHRHAAINDFMHRALTSAKIQHALNHWASIVQMESVLMGSP